MKSKILLLNYLLLVSINLFGQDTLYLKKWSHPKKHILIDSKQYINLNLKSITNDSSGIKTEITLNGTLRKINDSSLTFAVQTELTYLRKKNVISTNISNTYFQDHPDKITGLYYGDEIRTVKFDNINTVTLPDSKRFQVANIAGPLIGLSFLTTLFIAPLASINYKKSSFNLNRYYTIAGCGLIGVAIGIPILIFSTDNNDYNIKMLRENTDEDSYFLSNKK